MFYANQNKNVNCNWVKWFTVILNTDNLVAFISFIIIVEIEIYTWIFNGK